MVILKFFEIMNIFKKLEFIFKYFLFFFIGLYVWLLSIWKDNEKKCVIEFNSFRFVKKEYVIIDIMDNVIVYFMLFVRM